MSSPRARAGRAKAEASPKAAARASDAASGSASTSSRSIASSSGSLAELAKAGGSKAIKVTEDIDSLIQQQKDQRAHRRKIAQDLKNAKKKKQRLQKRARLMSTEDLLTVVALREKDNFNADELFGDSQANEDDPDDGSHDLEGGEPNLRDAEPVAREGSPVANT